MGASCRCFHSLCPKERPEHCTFPPAACGPAMGQAACGRHTPQIPKDSALLHNLSPPPNATKVFCPTLNRTVSYAHVVPNVQIFII